MNLEEYKDISFVKIDPINQSLKKGGAGSALEQSPILKVSAIITIDASFIDR